MNTASVKIPISTFLLERANASANPEARTNEKIQPFSTYVQSKQETLIQRIVCHPKDDPLRQGTRDHNRPAPFHFSKSSWSS